MKLMRVYKDVINEDFKSQTKKFIGQGIEPDVVKTYIDKFKHIRDKKYKEAKAELKGVAVPPERRFDVDAYKDFHELERVVDYVGGQRSVTTSMKGDIEVSGEAIFKNDDLEVFYADNPRACVKYKGKIPYSWCVARSDSSNMFYTYRFKPYEPAFYFVKDLKATEKEFKLWNMGKNVFKGKFSNPYHFFVIQVPKNADPDEVEREQYIVTSANNDGDNQMSWNDIVKMNPKLKSIKEVLKPKPFTPEEREQHVRFRDGISDNEFAKLSYEDKRNYLDIYPTIGKAITFNQLKALPDDLLNLYVSFGIGLDEEQHGYVMREKRKAFKRYSQITKRKFDEYISKESAYERNQLRLNWSELSILPDHDIDSYLGTLDSKDIKNFVQENGWEALDLIKKHLPSKFDKEDKNIVPLIMNAHRHEESLIKLEGLVPEGVEVGANTSYISFDMDYVVDSFWKDLNVGEDVQSMHETVWDDNYSYEWYGYNEYFDGYKEGLEIEVNTRLEEIIKDDDTLESEFNSVGLKFDVETMRDLLATYKNLEDVEEEVGREFSEAENRGIEKIGRELGTKMDKILRVNGSHGEVYIHPRALIMHIHDNEFFTTDLEEFKGNMSHLLEELYGEYDFPNEYYDFVEQTREGGMGQEPVDDGYLIKFIKDQVEDSLEKYVNTRYEEDDSEVDPRATDTKLKRLKSEVINHLNTTLEKLGQDPKAEFIENEIVKIGIDRDRFKLNGQVFITLISKNGKRYNGYVDINDIPTYFTNYKLFEAIQRFKSIITY